MKTKLKNFVILPRLIKDDYLNGKMTKNEFDTLIWIWLNANPINGSMTISYKGLQQDMRGNISYANARKIISSLRANNYIYFTNHKGRKGSFPVYPVGFLLSNKKIQTLDYIKNKLSITTQSQCKKLLNTKLQNSFDTQYHNFEKQKVSTVERVSIDAPNTQITTPNNDNETKTYKGSIIDVENFSPNNYEEGKCWEIAKLLGEKDMTFLLNRLEKLGFNAIEQTWGIFKEKDRKNINNKPAYFNTLLDQLNKNKD